MNRLEHIRFVRHQVSPQRRHYVNEDDVRVVLSRLPEELWARLRKVHFKDDSRGARRLGYTTRRGRREITLCALPYQDTIRRGTLGAEEFGALRGCQWPTLAIRRQMLYDTFLHEFGHLQIYNPKSPNPERKFYGETLAQQFADEWRRKLWSQAFDHPDPVHNPPGEAELTALRAGWVKANLAYRKGQALKANGKEREAVPHFRRAIELYPDHALALQHLGTLTYFGYAQGGAYTEWSEEVTAEAVGMLQRAVALDPALPEATMFLAMALARQNHREEARRMFEWAIQLDPYVDIARTQYADALANWGEYRQAAILFKKVLERDPLNEQALSDYAWLLLTRRKEPPREDRQKALELLKKAVKLSPESDLYHFRLAVAYESFGERRSAIEHARESLRLRPGYRSAESLLARLQRA